MVQNIHYSLGFTAGAAFIPESVTVAKLYLDIGNWARVKKTIYQQNSLQVRTLSTLKRIYQEIEKRLKHLSPREMSLVASSENEQVSVFIWLAICRQYTFIRDFVLEVVMPKYDQAQFVLFYEDYNRFFDEKAQWHESLDKVSDLTKRKARQVLFRMLKECGIIDEQYEIAKQNVSSEVIMLIQKGNADDLQLLPGIER